MNMQSNNVISIYDTLCKIMEKAIKAAYPDLIEPPIIVTSSTNPKFGDYQCNSPMSLVPLLTSPGMSFILFLILIKYSYYRLYFFT